MTTRSRRKERRPQGSNNVMTPFMHLNITYCAHPSMKEHLCDSKVGNDTLYSSGHVGNITWRNLASVDKHLEVGESTIDAAGVWVQDKQVSFRTDEKTTYFQKGQP
jgi:hypothetical protein